MKKKTVEERFNRIHKRATQPFAKERDKSWDFGTAKLESKVPKGTHSA